MTRTQRLQTLLAAASELPAGERQAYLLAQCGDDAALRDEVESLLMSHDAAGAFLSSPTKGAVSWTQPIATAPASELPGTRIGPYTLIEQLGEGGFGTVFLAEQTTPVARKVALKIIKLGMDTRQVVARFEHERQALAMMEHPGIARVFDAGATETGRPYFVMELVQGEPIITYCDKHSLSIDARLALFAEVCQAVQHAHTKGIIHRDIKPTNILVTTQDAKPHAKVIDFGIAKATQSKLTERTIFTEMKQLVGTPEYMSPEQAQGIADIDTRTDVYSLGVLLYELITGTTPFPGRELRSAAYAEIQRIIAEVEPPKPSTRLTGNTQTIASVAAQRQIEPRRLGSIVRGELDWIVMKALEKDRARRYESANDFAIDVKRYLSGDPVNAAPPSAAYRGRKFIRRHRVMVTAGAAVAAALVLGVAGTAWQATIASREAAAAREARDAATIARDAERARADELTKVSEFQSRMLAQIDPTRAGVELMDDVRSRHAAAMEKANVPLEERETRADALQQELSRVNATDTAAAMIDRTILRPAVATIEQQFRDQPVVDAQLRESIANIYQAIGLFDAALPLRESALATRRRVLGEEHPDTLESLGLLGRLLLDQAKPMQAEPMLREALDSKRRVLGETHRSTLTTLGDIGSALRAQGKLDDAKSIFSEVLEKRRQLFGENDPDTLIAMNNLGFVLNAQGNTADAELLYRQAYDRRRNTLGVDHPDTLFSLNNLGTLLQSRGQIADAEACFREAMERRRRVLGESHPQTLTSIIDLGNLLRAQGRLDEAEPLLRESVDITRRILGPDHRFAFTAMNNLAMLMRARGDLDNAASLNREVLAARRRVLGEDHPETLVSLNNLAFVLAAQGKLSDAESAYREGLERSQRVNGMEHPTTQAFTVQLGRCLHLQARNEEAITLLAPAEPLARKAFTGDSVDRLGVLLLTLGRARLDSGYDAERFTLAEANLIESQQILSVARGPTHAESMKSITALIDFYDAWHRFSPGMGHDLSAAKWRLVLSSVKPATPPVP